MAQNIFMAQTNFLIPLRGLGKKYRKQLQQRKAKIIEPYYCVDKPDIECCYISLEKHDFYFKSFPNNSMSHVFHKVTLEPYVISYCFSPKNKKRLYFLVVSVKTDKCFAETYIPALKEFVSQPSCCVCTDRDLIYLQKSFYENTEEVTSKKGLFYPFNNPIKNHITWVKELCCRLEGKKERDLSFEYSAINVISSDINFSISPVDTSKEAMDQRMAEDYYAPHHHDLEDSQQEEYARFAMCLISGNDNINNVSKSAVKEFASHFYSTNKYEKTYASKQGIVFLQAHYPFDLSAEEYNKYQRGDLPIYWPGDLECAHNIFELCTMLFFKQKLERISKRLGEKQIAGIKEAFANLANYLRMERTAIEDIDKKFLFVRRQMGIDDDFIKLKNEADQQFNSYSLRLSTRFNKLAIVLTAAALFPAVLQIIQTFIYNQKSSVMECHCCEPADCGTSISTACGTYCYHDPIIFTLIMFAVILALIGLYLYVLIPYIKKMHKQFHEEMEDEM